MTYNKTPLLTYVNSTPMTIGSTGVCVCVCVCVCVYCSFFCDSESNIELSVQFIVVISVADTADPDGTGTVAANSNKEGPASSPTVNKGTITAPPPPPPTTTAHDGTVIANSDCTSTLQQQQPDSTAIPAVSITSGSSSLVSSQSSLPPIMDNKVIN